MSVVSFHVKFGADERAIHVQLEERLTEAQERYFSAKMSQCLGVCVRSLKDPDFEWWRWEVSGQPPWLKGQFDNAEKTVAGWSDAKCAAAGIPRGPGSRSQRSPETNSLRSEGHSGAM